MLRVGAICLLFRELCRLILLDNFDLPKKGSPLHQAPTIEGFGEDQCFESMTSRSQWSNRIVVPSLILTYFICLF